MSKREFKPLLFTTTVRNPSRMKGLLNVLSKFNGEILTNELAETIMGELIRYGLYRPTRGITLEIEGKWNGKRITEKSSIGIQLLSDKEVKDLLKKNPQNHAESGFNKGWPSRFATMFDFAKELGFVYFWQNKKIEFSEVGLRLANSIEFKIKEGNILISDSHPEFEQQAFLHALAKYQRNNPFVKVLNDNVPLVLLLQVIKKLNSDQNLKGVGISRMELPFLIFWKNNDADELFKFIKDFRTKYGANPSWEAVIEICVDVIMKGKFKKFKPKSIITEYPDEFIRKMRLTGLISLRGGGRYIDINKKEQEKVDYVLNAYAKYEKYSSEREYFDYMAKTDENLIITTTEATTIEENNKYLENWVKKYPWEKVRSELLILAKKGLSKDDVLKYLSNPIRLEFLISLAIKNKFPLVAVLPNYPCDDEGLPTSTAGGNGDKGDIECFENDKGILVEVTMSEGRTQTMMEVWPISRHLEEFRKNSVNSMCYFVAPSIFKDSVRQIDFVKEKDKLIILPKTIEEFLEHINACEVLYCK